MNSSNLNLSPLESLSLELGHAFERPAVIIQLLIILFCISSSLSIGFLLKRINFIPKVFNPMLAPIFSLLTFSLAKLFYGLFTPYGELLSKAINLNVVFLILVTVLAVLSWKRSHVKVQFYKRRLVIPVFVAFSLLSLIDLFANSKEILGSPIISLFGSPINLGNILLITFGLYWWIVASSLITDFLQWAFGLRNHENLQSDKGIYMLIRYALIGLGLFIVIGYIGINPTIFGLITGGLSVGIGFGLKEVFSNFASGIWLLIEGSVKPGDIINMSRLDQSQEPYELGVITSLGLRAATVVVQSDNSERIIPNQSFFTNQILTYTKNHHVIARKVYVGVSYDSNPLEIIPLLHQIASEHPNIIENPKPIVFFSEYGCSSLNFILKFWITEISDGKRICSEINCRIWDIFKQNGIEIPYPQRVNHLRNIDRNELIEKSIQSPKV